MKLEDQKKYHQALNDFAIGYSESGIKQLKNLQKIYPTNARLNHDLGVGYTIIKNYLEAIKYFDIAVKLDQSDLQFIKNRAQCFLTINKYSEALEDFNYLEKRINNAEIYYGKGLCYFHQEQIDLSIFNFKIAYSLDSKNISVLYDLAVCLEYSNNFVEAINFYEKVIHLMPQHIKSLINKNICLENLHQFDEASKNYNELEKKYPSNVSIKWNHSLLKLRLGDFKEGWKLYEWRKKKENFNLKKNYLPEWTGKENILNKTIYVYTEQGFGDFIQFSRFFESLKKLGAKIITDPDESLKLIVKKSFSYIEFYSKSNTNFDYCCALMSLPFLLKISINSIPSKNPYFYFQKNNKINLEKNNRKKIGLFWSGNPNHKNDRNRSIKLKEFENLLKLSFQFHSLQIDYRKEDLTLVDKYLIRHESEITNFNDTANIINQMDLILTVDSSIAHLSGAMGKNTWLLLNFLPDFRWMTDESSTIWYPNMKIYRQSKDRNWKVVIDKIYNDLNKIND